MKKNTKKILLRFCAAVSLALAVTCTAWAEETSPDADAASETAETTVSRVITVGAGETAATEEPEEEAKAAETDTKGESLGMFTTTGYCNCSKCSGGHGLTYSGTVPQANHTISADLNHYPIGTKLMIDDVIYTVEDMGSSVKGSWIDIYYATHEEAVAHGMKSQEVFRVLEE